MGLDTVELLMEVEDKFQINFTNKEAEQICTVGDFYNSILGKLELKSDSNCLSQKLFYRMRISLSAILKIPPESISPQTELISLFPINDRMEKWGMFQQTFALSLPELDRPRRLRSFFDYSLGTIVLGVLISVAILLIFKLFTPIVFVFSFSIVTVLLWKVTKPLKKHFTDKNMRKLVETVLLKNASSLGLFRKLSGLVQLRN